MLSHFSHVWFLATLQTVARKAPLSMGILQARILEWVTMPSSRGSSWRKDQIPVSSASWTGRRVLYKHHLGSPIHQYLDTKTHQMMNVSAWAAANSIWCKADSVFHKWPQWESWFHVVFQNFVTTLSKVGVHPHAQICVVFWLLL